MTHAHNIHDLIAGPPKDITCERCIVSPATEWWTGDSSFSDLNHGMGTLKAWCKRCCIEERITFWEAAAKTAADLLPKLREELVRL